MMQKSLVTEKQEVVNDGACNYSHIIMNFGRETTCNTTGRENV